MELSTIIPTNTDPNWIIKGEFLMYKKYTNVPIAYIEDDVVFIFLDLKVTKALSKLITHLTNNKIKFFFDSPEFSNPSANLRDYNTKVVSHYLFSYSKENVFYLFKKIDFDLIKNMVDFCDRNDCHDILKECYEKVKKTVARSNYDYYTGKHVFEYSQEIREEFENLYRDIQISRII